MNPMNYSNRALKMLKRAKAFDEAMKPQAELVLDALTFAVQAEQVFYQATGGKSGRTLSVPEEVIHARKESSDPEMVFIKYRHALPSHIVRAMERNEQVKTLTEGLINVPLPLMIWETDPTDTVDLDGMPVRMNMHSLSFAYLTKDCFIPALLMDGALWMSYTPNEILTQYPAVRKAEGHVFIGGLGMGWLARRIADKKSVSKVTIAESNPAVIDLIAPQLVEHYNGKVKVIEDDAYNVVEDSNGRYDVIAMDVWAKQGTAASDERWKDVRHQAELALCDNGGRRHGKLPVIWAWGEN